MLCWLLTVGQIWSNAPTAIDVFVDADILWCHTHCCHSLWLLAFLLRYISVTLRAVLDRRVRTSLSSLGKAFLGSVPTTKSAVSNEKPLPLFLPRIPCQSGRLPGREARLPHRSPSLSGGAGKTTGGGGSSISSSRGGGRQPSSKALPSPACSRRIPRRQLSRGLWSPILQPFLRPNPSCGQHFPAVSSLLVAAQQIKCNPPVS